MWAQFTAAFRPLPRTASALLASAFAVLLLAEPAAAYIDPGTGSMIIQGVIAAVVGGAVALRMRWRRVKTRLTGTKGSEESGPEADERR